MFKVNEMIQKRVITMEECAKKTMLVQVLFMQSMQELACCDGCK